MLTISYAGCLGLSAAILAQFTLEMCSPRQKLKKTSKLIVLGVV